MKIEDCTFVVIDTETTGLEPLTDEIVEIAAVAVDHVGNHLGMIATLVKPVQFIPPEISAIHGLTNDDVVNAPTPRLAALLIETFASRFSNVVFVAHNAEFDAPFVRKIAVGKFTFESDWLCTKRLAMHVWPEAPNHRNQTLRYWRDLNPETFGIAPHRALGDCLVTAAILVDELAEIPRKMADDIEQIIAWAESPAELLKMPLGKHKGQAFPDLPADYLSWALRGMTDASKDLRYTIEREMERRSA